MDIEHIARVVEMVERSAVKKVSIQDGKHTITVTNHPTQPNRTADKTNRTADKKSIDSEESIDLKSEDNNSNEQICAPYVGQVYLSADGAMDALVQEGGSVKKGQTVGYINELTRLRPIISQRSGILSKILVTDGAWVEYGQPLFMLEDK